MAEYVKLLSQFHHFINSNRSSITSEYEKKLINIILGDFDNVARATTAAGQRGKHLNLLIQEKGKSVASEIGEFENFVTQSGYDFQRLESIELESFRGFSSKETIAFPTRLIFIYGPNGSGKTSFCEALEFSMLSYINEAIRKNIKVEQYTKNNVTGVSKKPILLVSRADGSKVEIRPDLNNYQFFFIEKNRIEEFSRISSNTPAKVAPLIATLFGLKEFAEFVKNFTENIDKQVNIEAKKKLELDGKSAVKNQRVIDVQTCKTKQTEIETRQKEFALGTNLGAEFSVLKKTILGVPQEAKGLITDLEEELSKPVPTKLELSKAEILSGEIDALKTDLAALTKTCTELSQKSGQTNFQRLFEAAIALKEGHSEHCPLCLTDIKAAKGDPYSRAEQGLSDLRTLAELQNSQSLQLATFQKSYDKVRGTIEARQLSAKAIGLEKEILSPTVLGVIETANLSSRVSEFEKTVNQLVANLSTHTVLDEAVVLFNSDAEKKATARTALANQKDQLNVIVAGVEKFELEQSMNAELMAKHESEIKEFDEANKALLAEVEKEKIEVEENIKYVAAYRSFLTKLQKYNEDLPVRLVSELNGLTLEIYNVINRHDFEYEKLAEVNLPSDADAKLTVCFKDKPGTAVDALQILSEGHLRCLGLSILLAKAIKDGAPVIVFDDIVNALDEDHRGGVRELIFKYALLREKQILLTTHSEIFIMELESDVAPPDYQKLVTKYQFNPDTTQRKIRVKERAHKNYLVEANKLIQDNDLKEALYKCRCALENIKDKIWTKIDEKKYAVELSVVISGPKSQPQLMSAVAALRKFVKETATEFQDVIPHFDYLMGLNGSRNAVWFYLNKGTHVEDGQSNFDVLIVKELHSKLVELDILVKSGVWSKLPENETQISVEIKAAPKKKKTTKKSSENQGQLALSED